MKNKFPNNNRRSFVKKLAGGMLATGISPILVQARAANQAYSELIPLRSMPSYSPNDVIRVAAIGLGIQGFGNLRAALKVPGVELVAGCDLYDGRLQRAKEIYGNQLETTRDYREILSRSDVDAVIVSTPDHWHDKISIEAMKAGKAVYCEKPMVQYISEGKAVIDAQKSSGQVFQVGSQRVSSILFAKAKELYASGLIGQLIMVEANYDRQSANGAWQYSIPTDASPETVDWERFLGDTPKRSFDKTRFFRWRNYQDYGTGVGGDLFVHLFSGLHVLLDSNGPERVFATGGLRYWKDGRDVPDVFMALCDYPENSHHPAFNMQIRVNFIDGSGGGSTTRLIGTEGTMEIGWSGITIKKSKPQDIPTYGNWDSFDTFTSDQQKTFEAWHKNHYPAAPPRMIEPQEMVYSVPQGYSDHVDHFANFFHCMRSGTTVVEDASFGLRAAAPSLACNTSYFEKRVVQWDPELMVER
ncbi:MAG: Gfo/Idh/MocA family oxidoreductase [Bacteroidota bacterium]